MKISRHKRQYILSIIIPTYNEEKTLKRCVERVLEISDTSISLEIIIVDDGSVDKSPLIAGELDASYPEIAVLCHARNQGKGAALRTGFKKASGDLIAVQDADLESNPMELMTLVKPLINNEADVVMGSRFLSLNVRAFISITQYFGNRFVTFLSNLFTGMEITDMMTCYKVFKREVVQGIDIKENRFGVEPEIVAKIARKGLRVLEMGVSYHPRTYKEGKKIRLWDGVRVIYCIFRYNIFRQA